MKYFRIVIPMIFSIVLLFGCSPKSNSNTDGGSDAISEGMDGEVSDDSLETQVFEAEVIETGTSMLVSPDSDSNEYKSSDKMAVNLTGSTITDSQGNDITMEELKPGDILSITYNGMIAESYPAQISASKIAVIDQNQ